PEFERSVAMRRLALQQYPIEMASISKDIVRAVESTVKATTEYAEELALECLKVSTYLKGVESMTSSVRINQIIALMEDLECRVQNLIRYGWSIEREWNTYVLPPVSVHEQHMRKGLSRVVGVFPSAYLRNLDTWHVTLTNAIARVRLRSAEASYSSRGVNGDAAQPWEAMGVVYSLNPTHWSTEYVLEKAKSERSKKRRSDSWLDAVPHITGAQSDRKPSARLVDVRRRNPMHYAAMNAADLLWLKRLNYLDLQDIRVQGEDIACDPALNNLDLFGDSPLTIAAQAGNTSAVKYIVEESGVEIPGSSVVDAILVSIAEGHHDAMSVLINWLVSSASAEDIVLVFRMAMFYGFKTLFDSICEEFISKDADMKEAVANINKALDQATQSGGGCTLLHLAALNNRPEMIRSSQDQSVFKSRGFDAHVRDDAHITPLDAANYFGYRGCGDILLTTFPQFHPQLALKFNSEDAALKVQQLSPVNYSGVITPVDTYAVYAGLGATDTRRNAMLPPISIDRDALNSVLDDIGLPRSTHLLLRIDSEQGMEINNPKGWLMDVTTILDDPTMAEHTWVPPAHFHTVYPERFVLKLDLIALIDQALLPHASEHKVIACAALSLPPTYIPKYSERMPGHYIPVCPTGGSYLNAVFVSVASDDIVGEANIEVFVATPYGRRRSGSTNSCSNADKRGLKAPPVAVNGVHPSVAVNGSSNAAALSNSSSISASSLALASNSVSAMPVPLPLPAATTKPATTNGSSKPSFARLPEMLPWYQQGQTLVYGHRGSGMNFAPMVTPRKLQLGENTILSMEKAVRDGVAAVEFDVQITRDMVPVIYHDWIVAETGFDVTLSALTLNQFLACNPRNQPVSEARTCESIPTKGSMAVVPGHACQPMHIANSVNTVQAPFATLQELFETLPVDVGFDIEVKYPMPDEADEFGVFTSFEINLFVDCILDVVYSHMQPATDTGSTTRRPIVFTSFHPDICLLLAHKINGDIPVMLLTDAGMSAMADCRCNSIDAAVRMCNWAGLAGIVTHVGPISQSPRVASLVRRHQLVLATYGSLNNQPDHVKQQQAYGVDIVIADDVRSARAAVDSSA
ncbi:Glycerophosphocholine phosphodiesterase, partial [Coemansia sp. RSA 1722]